MTTRPVIRSLWGTLLALLLAACVPSIPRFTPSEALAPAPTPAPQPTTAPTPRPTTAPTLQPTATPIPSATPLPTATVVPLSPTPTLAPLSDAQRIEIFEQVWELVRDRYVYPDYRGVDWQAVREEFAPRVAAAATPEEFYVLMQEMIERLGDEHSYFMTPQDVAEQATAFAGEFRYAGIGAVIRSVDEGGLIVKIAAGGPAEEAGLHPRDLIVQVGGRPFTDTEAFGPLGPVGAIRGEPGTEVRLLVRSPQGTQHEVTITRRIIPADAFPDVEAQWLPGDRVGLLTIDTFDAQELDQRVREQIERLSTKGPLDGLIVDVRDNSGGRIDLLLNTLALFVHNGAIGTSRSRDHSHDLTIPEGQALPQLEGVPVVVLIGPDTISAAEMFAAGLRARERARVVGMPSAGNVENMLPHDLPDGSRLLLAELTYYLPDGGLIEGQGVQPDRVVDAEWWRYPPSEDPQILAALEELRRDA